MSATRDDLRAARREGKRAAYEEIAAWARRHMTQCLKNSRNHKALSGPDWNMNRFTVWEIVAADAMSRSYKVRP